MCWLKITLEWSSSRQLSSSKTYSRNERKRNEKTTKNKYYIFWWYGRLCRCRRWCCRHRDICMRNRFLYLCIGFDDIYFARALVQIISMTLTIACCSSHSCKLHTHTRIGLNDEHEHQPIGEYTITSTWTVYTHASLAHTPVKPIANK